MRRVVILKEAAEDLEEAREFYDAREEGKSQSSRQGSLVKEGIPRVTAGATAALQISSFVLRVLVYGSGATHGFRGDMKEGYGWAV